MALLAVDIGNSSVHAGIFDPATNVWVRTLRFVSGTERTADEWYSLFQPHFRNAGSPLVLTRVASCSVVPALTTSFVEYSRRYLSAEPMVVSAALDLGVSIATQQPYETGADRIVNAAAAYAGYGGPVVVVDMGTATKIDAVSERGEFLGGAIAPGLGLSMNSLAQRAAQLRAVPLTAPVRAIGANTVAAMQSGIVLGHASMVDGLVEKIAGELGGAVAVVLTGGYSGLLLEICETVTHHRPDLTLEGLALIAARNL